MKGNPTQKVPAPAFQVPTFQQLEETLTAIVTGFAVNGARAGLHPMTLRSACKVLSQLKFDNTQGAADIQAIIRAATQELLDEIKVQMLRESVPASSLVN